MHKHSNNNSHTPTVKKALPGLPEQEQATFELMSAGLVNFLPSIAADEHESIYRQMMYYRRLSVFEQAEFAALDCVGCEGYAEECIAYLKSKPAIVCTMHTGSYRLINLLLIRERIRFSLVIGSTVLAQEGAIFQQIYADSNTNGNDFLQLIDAEQGNAGIKMIRALKEGRSLVLYLDGHTGAGTNTKMNCNHCVVDFLAQQLYVRKGIAQLAFTTAVPILPVVCYRLGTEGMRLRFYPFYEPDTTKCKEEFAQTTTQLLYSVFAEIIKAHPGQWEGWLTIHRNTKLVHTTTTTTTTYGDSIGQKKSGEVSFNRFRFGIFKTAGMPYLLEKHTYLFYALGEELYQLLVQCRNAPVACAGMNCELLYSLIETGVLQYVEARGSTGHDYDYTCE